MNYESICKKFVKFFHVNGSKKVKVSQEFLDSLHFTGMDLEPYEIVYFSYICSIIALFIALLIDIIIFAIYGFSVENMGIFTLLLIILIPSILPLTALHYISEYPKIKARYMKIHSLGDIPEVLSYIVMYLKLVPNLERAIHFAASESNTSLAKDLRKLIWDLEIRIHKSIDDAITYFANLWGEWSDYFKRALHLIRSSVRERKEAERAITLNRALDVVLDGTKNAMIAFSNKLHQPTLVIYSIGVMIPLALVAMLPAASVVGLRLSIFNIFIIYDVLLPMALFFYIRKVLSMRPATFNPPAIPKSSVKVNKKINMLLSLFIFIIFLPLLYFHKIFLIWGIGMGISFYCISSYKDYKKLRDEIKEMEEEFSDSLYILGKRITEGKPPEEAFSYAAETMKGSKIGEIFSITSYNLISRRTTAKEALFNKEYGSLKNVFSDRIRAIMKLFVEGAKKSYEAAGVAIVKIADHLKQLQEVERRIKDNLGILTSSLRTTAVIFAPLIGGVTLGITKLIANVISSLNYPSLPEDLSISLFGKGFSIQQVPYEYFVLAIGIYILVLVVLLLRFANGIDEGDDKIEYLYSLGKAMPISLFIFTASTFFSSFLFFSL